MYRISDVELKTQDSTYMKKYSTCTVINELHTLLVVVVHTIFYL